MMAPSKRQISLLILVVLASASAGLECPHSGVFRHPEDCTKLYTCHGDHVLGFSIQQHKCPAGTVVDSNKLQCVEATKVPSCDFKKFSPAASDPLCDNQVVHCSDCTHLVTCSLFGGEYINPREDFCGTDINNLPLYCDPTLKKCVDKLPGGCNVPGFVCTSPGLFPDPDKCDIFHVCSENTLYDSNRCVTGSYPTYNSHEFRCEEMNNVGCERVYCDGNGGVFPYPSDDRYYVYCSPNIIEIYKCRGSERFNLVTGQCEFTCQTIGLFVDMTDCSKYIRCSADQSGQLVSSSEYCPSELAFNPNSNSCDGKSSVKCPPA